MLDSTATTSPLLQAHMEAGSRPSFVTGDNPGRHLWQEERRFYVQNGYRLMWSDGKRPGAAYQGLLRVLRAADREGLSPADYGVDDLTALGQGSLDDARAADLDSRATYSYLAYAWHLTHGTRDPKNIDPRWHAAPRDVDLHLALQKGLAQNQIEASLQKLAPASPQYAGLKHQLARYRAMPSSPEVDERIERIVLNLERWRWLPDNLGPRYVMVNIPAFRLDVIENGHSVLGMKVIVGTPNNPTPVFSDQMTSVVFSPAWNIPPGIVRNETLPHISRDPAYLERNRIEIVRDAPGAPEVVDPATVDWSAVDASSLRFRQKPGKGNSLGLVKFIFPNHFNVYLHDTPTQSLFDRIERDFSHGCVRLERPVDLARYVLGDQPAWTTEKIDEAMHAGVERSVTLKQPLPVYLVYFTAWEEDGDVQVGDDVYGYDKKQGMAAGL